MISIIRAGSVKWGELQDLAMDIFNMCLRNSIYLEVEWVPREKNQVADFYSKVFDYDDWSVSDRYFNYFNKIWGSFSCDVFADSNNFKVQNFCSPYWCPEHQGLIRLVLIGHYLTVGSSHQLNWSVGQLITWLL